MTTPTKAATGLAAAALAATAFVAATAPSDTGAKTSAARTVTVRISGGHATDARDHGRPVVLIAAALGVPAEVFREAFSHVDPAGAGQEPSSEQVRANKDALLRVLAPYGVTNDELDRVSNTYRYNGSAGEMWPTTAATARATVRNGKVVSIKVTRGGSGYTSAPTVTVPGYSTKIKATVRYGADIATNGRISSLKVR